MNVVLERMLKTGCTESAEGMTVPLESAVTQEEGEFLKQLVADAKPTSTIEIGLAYGVSSLFICEALESFPNARHTIIDPYQCRDNKWGGSWQGIGLKNLKEAGYEHRIHFIDLPAHQALPQLERQGRRFDFAFIDGWHTFDHALVEFFFIDKMLNPGGILALDDADWPSIRKLCRFIVTNRCYTVHRSLNGERVDRSRQHSIVRLMRRLPGQISRRIENQLKPEVLISDEDLGLSGRCIALRKQAEDNRSWDFHAPF